MLAQPRRRASELACAGRTRAHALLHPHETSNLRRLSPSPAPFQPYPVLLFPSPTAQTVQRPGTQPMARALREERKTRTRSKRNEKSDQSPRRPEDAPANAPLRAHRPGPYSHEHTRIPGASRSRITRYYTSRDSNHIITFLRKNVFRGLRSRRSGDSLRSDESNTEIQKQ